MISNSDIGIRHYKKLGEGFDARSAQVSDLAASIDRQVSGTALDQTPLLYWQLCMYSIFSTG
jgi:hypothetical protein